MTLWINGIASIPAVYTTVEGDEVYLSSDNLAQLCNDGVGHNFVMNHMEYEVSDVRGVITHLSPAQDGGMYYETVVNDFECESEIIRLREMGKIPNVSILATPSSDATIELNDEHSTPDRPVYSADKWDFHHLSLVSRGACSDADGCGVFGYTVLNSAQGTHIGCPRKRKHMAEDGTPTGGSTNGTPESALMTVLNDRNSEIDTLKLSLSELKDSLSARDAELEELRAFKQAQEEKELEARKAQVDELKNQILQHNPDAQLEGVDDPGALKVALSAYTSGQKGKFKASGKSDEDEKTPGQLAIEAAYAKRQEKFRGFAGMRKQE